MKKITYFFLKLLWLPFFFFLQNPVVYSDYDESRKIVRHSRGSGDNWSSMKRPDSGAENWQSTPIHIRNSKTLASEEEKAEYFSQSGGLHGKWHQPVLGASIDEEPIEGTYTKPAYGPKRWDKIEFAKYQEDLADPEKIGGLDSAVEVPKWSEGGILNWETTEPSGAPLDQPPQYPEGVSWKDVTPKWKTSDIEKENRPIYHVEHTS